MKLKTTLAKEKEEVNLRKKIPLSNLPLTSQLERPHLQLNHQLTNLLKMLQLLQLLQLRR